MFGKLIYSPWLVLHWLIRIVGMRILGSRDGKNGVLSGRVE